MKKALKFDDHGVDLGAELSFLPWKQEAWSPPVSDAPKELRRQLQELLDTTQGVPADLLSVKPTGISLVRTSGRYSWAEVRQLLKELDIAIDTRGRGIIVEDGKRYDEFSPRLHGEDRDAARERARLNWEGDHRYAPCCDNEVRGMNGGCANCGMPCL